MEPVRRYVLPLLATVVMALPAVTQAKDSDGGDQDATMIERDQMHSAQQGANSPAAQPAPRAAARSQLDTTWRRDTFRPDSYWRGTSAEDRQFSRGSAPMAQGMPHDGDAALAERRSTQNWDIYGFDGTEGGAMESAAPAGGAVGSNIAENVPDTKWRVEANSDWRHAKNLVDDNLIQTRDSFDVPGDFYTKEWKVSEPPLVAHTRFKTIYDDDLTESYYTPWFGSPVVWAPNKMVKEPMPQASNEGLLSKKQQVTYFTSWKHAETQTLTPASLAWGTPQYASFASASRTPANVYGYQAPEGGITRDGAIHLGGQTLFFDDQDVIGPTARGVASASGGGNIYGFISPESNHADKTPGTTVMSGNIYQNIPRSNNVDIYGVPTANAKHLRSANGAATYGYAEPESHQQKKCDHDKD